MEFSIPLNPGILSAVARVDHFRGTFAMASLSADRARRLREAARVQSIGASCRLSGIRVTDAEVAAILLERGGPLQDTGAVLSLDAGLEWVEADTTALLSTESLAALHAVVSGTASDPELGPWRVEPASREAFSSEGTALGRVFQTLPPHLIPQKTEDLLSWLEIELRSGTHHPLPLIATFLLAFMVICPFRSHNGRIARVLVTRLLLHAGYEQVRYSSWERVLEERREAYYEAYDTAETRFWAGAPNLEAWVAYLLEVIDENRARLHSVLETESKAARLSPLQQKVMETLGAHGTVDAALLLNATGANRNTLKDNMRRLVKLGLVEKMGERRGTRYRLARGSFE
jgi:Fic family protein